MDLDVRTDDGIIIIKSLSKNIDADVCTEFKVKLMAIVNKGNKLFLIDLSQVDFIDSRGLGALISTLKKIKSNNGHLALCGLKSTVVNLFNITRMNQVFQIAKDETEGLELLKKITYA